MRGRPPKTTTPSDKGGKPDPDPYAARLAALEGRLQLAEEQLALIRKSRLGLELRALSAHAEARRIDAEQDREREQRRADAAPERAAKLADFGRERFAEHNGLAVSVSALLAAFDEWARERGTPALLRCADDGELVEAMRVAFPEHPLTDIESPGYMGNPIPLVDGYVGIAVAPVGQDPARLVADLERDEEYDAEESRLRREDRELHAGIRDGIVERQRVRDEAAAIMVRQAGQK
jgi:hypothetical protein